jgi:hypothetical protein
MELELELTRFRGHLSLGITGYEDVSATQNCAVCSPFFVSADARPTRVQPCGDLSLVETRLDHGDLVIGEAEKLIDEHVHAILAAHPLSSESFSGKRRLSANEFATETREFGGSPIKLLRNV